MGAAASARNSSDQNELTSSSNSTLKSSMTLTDLERTDSPVVVQQPSLPIYSRFGSVFHVDVKRMLTFFTETIPSSQETFVCCS